MPINEPPTTTARAASALRGEPEAAFADVPFFWTGQFGINLRYVGHAEGWDETVIDGDVSAKDAAVYYVSGGQVVAGAFVGRDVPAAAFEQLLARKGLPGADRVRGGFDPVQALAEG